MSGAYAKAAREALPHARRVVDRFHLINKANEMLDRVRRCVTPSYRARRGHKTDPEWSTGASCCAQPNH
jgi:transposase